MSHAFIADAAKRLFANEVDKGLIEKVEAGDFPKELWLQVVASGFTSLFSKEAMGGIEATWEDAYPVFYNMGYYQAPLPIAETAIANLLLSAGNAGFVTDLPIAIASYDQAEQPLVLDASAGTLTGALRNVKWGRHAGFVVIGIDAGQLALVDLSAVGVSVEEGLDTSKMAADRLVLAQSPVHALFANPFTNLADPVKVLGAGARAAMMVGALEFALDQSVQYAKDRVQFGKPIGKNQAIQQQLALMAGEVAVARASAVMACKDMPHVNRLIAPSAEFSVAAAKVCTGEAVATGTSIAHQVHGAIGFTYEHSLNFATRRLWAWRGDFGNAASWAGLLGQAFAQQPGERFWHSLTERVIPG
jgi:acyl-CoA dehydrogenase